MAFCPFPFFPCQSCSYADVAPVQRGYPFSPSPVSQAGSQSSRPRLKPSGGGRGAEPTDGVAQGGGGATDWTPSTSIPPHHLHHHHAPTTTCRYSTRAPQLFLTVFPTLLGRCMRAWNLDVAAYPQRPARSAPTAGNAFVSSCVPRRISLLYSTQADKQEKDRGQRQRRVRLRTGQCRGRQVGSPTTSQADGQVLCSIWGILLSCFLLGYAV